VAVELLHPAVQDWFLQSIGQPTDPQKLAWPAIRQHKNTLIAAPTGTGKTLAAFMSSIDELVIEGLEHDLPDETRVLYVSPLKALSNDIQKNLQSPISGIRDSLLEHGLPDVEIRAWVRTGDTPQSERQKMRKKPPHIVVTTPESLFILLTSESGREMLATVHTVIIDEIHALAGNKRGAHLMLSLERLSALCIKPPVRIGISATQKPIETMAKYLCGEEEFCNIIDTGHVRQRDLEIEVPDSPLEAVMANEVWAEIYQRLEEQVTQHSTTLIFVNTRRLAERAAHHLAERLGDDAVTAHHGSLSREHRLNAETRLKQGQLKALVATASLELGIDIGDIDLVCQIGSPRSIATFLQRVGRAGHSIGAVPKGRLFPLTRDDLVECTAILDAIQHDELDHIVMQPHPLDVLAQQIIAEVANREWDKSELYNTFKQAWIYRDLTQANFDAIIKMLADGYSTRRGRRGAYLHYDAVNQRLRARRGARLVALTNGGAIPDQFNYDVILQPEGYLIGNLNEDFAFESLPGDIFQLGNTPYRFLKIEQGKVFVEDAKGQPPNIPFWFGDAPGRTEELSDALSRLRLDCEKHLEQGIANTCQWFIEQYALSSGAALQLTEYLAAGKAALGCLPSKKTIVFERFFDETGDMHFVIHSPFGARINRAWGLALRKRFCRKFNFELQAAATDNNIVLSLGPTHSFPLEEVVNYLKAGNVREILIQALLDSPMFETRWRWNSNISLAVPRNRNGKRVPAQFQRNDAEDLIAVIFPDQLACLENIAGNREIPQHPLVEQTLSDCLNDTMDINALEQLLEQLHGGEIKLVCCNLTTPSPLAQEVINANPYAFLDDAPAEERRTLAIQQRRHIDPASAAELGTLDPAAIRRVKSEAWPDPVIADELHDAMVLMAFMTEAEATAGPVQNDDKTDLVSSDWSHLFESLIEQQRVTLLTLPHGVKVWVSAERLALFMHLYPDASGTPEINSLPAEIDLTDEQTGSQKVLTEIIRSRLESLGPVTAESLAKPLALTGTQIDQCLLALEQEGFVIRGQFSQQQQVEWCERRLLARIHRYTVKRLRSEIEAVSPADFMRFLFSWQRVTDRGEGIEALSDIIDQLEGFAIPAKLWEQSILPARLDTYMTSWLDTLCITGRINWLRKTLSDSKTNNKDKTRASTTVSNTPICLINRQFVQVWKQFYKEKNGQSNKLSASAIKIKQQLERHGASFFEDLLHSTGLLRTQLESGLAELVNQSLITSDSFAGLRALLLPASKKSSSRQKSRLKRALSSGFENAGRWSLLKTPVQTNQTNNVLHSDSYWIDIEYIANSLLKRYGVIFRKLLERESALPPWRDLLYVLRRMEARGEIRGGRFVDGFSGEQFALPEAVKLIRQVKKEETNEDLVAISASDPLNLTGLITPGQKIHAKTTNRILYRNGIPVAVSLAGKINYLEQFDARTQWEIQNKLVRLHAPGHYIEMPHRHS
jgi:ATP-dependent Lhr-like helicase